MSKLLSYRYMRGILFLDVYVFLCVYVHRCACCRGQTLILGAFFNSSIPYVLDSLSSITELIVLPRLADKQTTGILCLCLSNAGVTGIRCQIQLLKNVRD